jgi:hypothetical protein
MAVIWPEATPAVEDKKLLLKGPRGLWKVKINCRKFYF